jgi:hypothetical protein
MFQLYHHPSNLIITVFGALAVFEACTTAWIGNAFDSIRRTKTTPGRPGVRAVDKRNLLLLLPFLLHTLLEEEVEKCDRLHLFDPLVDPSDGCIGMFLFFINW